LVFWERRKRRWRACRVLQRERFSESNGGYKRAKAFILMIHKKKIRGEEKKEKEGRKKAKPEKQSDMKEGDIGTKTNGNVRKDERSPHPKPEGEEATSERHETVRKHPIRYGREGPAQRRGQILRVGKLHYTAGEGDCDMECRTGLGIYGETEKRKA